MSDNLWFKNHESVQFHQTDRERTDGRKFYWLNQSFYMQYSRFEFLYILVVAMTSNDLSFKIERNRNFWYYFILTPNDLNLHVDPVWLDFCAWFSEKMTPLKIFSKIASVFCLFWIEQNLISRIRWFGMAWFLVFQDFEMSHFETSDF